jgi:hypothetical protein
MDNSSEDKLVETISTAKCESGKGNLKRRRY